MTFLKELLSQHFAAILYTLIGVVAVGLAMLVKLFHELRTDPSTRKAVKQELWVIRTIVGFFKPSVLPKPGEPDPLAETAMPFKAVPRPERIEDEEGG